VSTKDFYQEPSSAPRTNNYLTFVFPGFAAHPGLYAAVRSADSLNSRPCRRPLRGLVELLGHAVIRFRPPRFDRVIHGKLRKFKFAQRPSFLLVLRNQSHDLQ